MESKIYSRTGQEPSQYDPKLDTLRFRKEQLIRELKTICGISGSKKKPLNILVIGSPGSGKSSFINTAIASVRTDNWVQCFSVGDIDNGGISSHITNHFQRFGFFYILYK